LLLNNNFVFFEYILLNTTVHKERGLFDVIISPFGTTGTHVSQWIYKSGPERVKVRHFYSQTIIVLVTTCLLMLLEQIFFYKTNYSILPFII